MARANRLGIGGREESEEDSEDWDSNEGKIYDKEGAVRDGGGWPQPVSYRKEKLWSFGAIYNILSNAG